MANEEHEHSLSIYGDMLLKGLVRADQSDLLERLAALNIHDAEQLIELMSVEGTPAHLAEHLQISVDELNRFVASVAALLPPERRTPQARLTRGPFSLGALEPTDQSRRDTGPFPPAAPPIALPSQVNHIAGMLAIQNQGQRGTCVAFGGTALTEYYWHTHSNSTKLSEEFLYEETKKIDGHSNLCGTWLVYAMHTVSSLGICPESVWPYNGNLPCNNNSPEPGNARQSALPFRVQGHMMNPHDVNSMKVALAQNCNVAFCIPVYNSWYQWTSPTARTGAITMRVGNEPAVGGHCMCMVGYQDNAASPGGGYFIIRNSWGTTWAYQSPYSAGYGTIPYQYLTNGGWEAATIP